MPSSITRKKVLLVLGGVVCAVGLLVFQLSLTFSHRYPQAAAEEFTQTKRLFVEEVRETLHKP